MQRSCFIASNKTMSCDNPRAYPIGSSRAEQHFNNTKQLHALFGTASRLQFCQNRSLTTAWMFAWTKHVWQWRPKLNCQEDGCFIVVLHFIMPCCSEFNTFKLFGIAFYNRILWFKLLLTFLIPGPLAISVAAARKSPECRTVYHPLRPGPWKTIPGQRYGWDQKTQYTCGTIKKEENCIGTDQLRVAPEFVFVTSTEILTLQHNAMK